jgi:hypothetical protein
MKSASRYVVVSVIVLSVAAFASLAFARGGHRSGGRDAGAGNLCTSGTLLDLSLSNVDLLIKVNGTQKAALDELKESAKNYSDSMSEVCAGDSPVDVPARLAAADERLQAALTGVRKLEPVADKFYATLDDEQKAEASRYVDWPGL